MNNWFEIKDDFERLDKYELLIKDVNKETSNEVMTSLLLGLDDPYEAIRFECLNKVPLDHNLILSYLEKFFKILYTDPSNLVRGEAALMIEEVFEIKFINYLYEQLDSCSLEKANYMMAIASLERGTKDSIKNYTKLINDDYVPTRNTFINSSFYFKDDIGEKKLERILEKRLKVEKVKILQDELRKNIDRIKKNR